MCPHLASAALDVEPGELTVLLPQVSSEVVLALLRLLYQGYLPLSNPGTADQVTAVRNLMASLGFDPHSLELCWAGQPLHLLPPASQSSGENVLMETSDGMEASPGPSSYGSTEREEEVSAGAGGEVEERKEENGNDDRETEESTDVREEHSGFSKWMKTGSDSKESVYCEDCGRDFVNARDLRLHRRKTHDRRLYVKLCPECGKEVVDLSHHMKVVHPDSNNGKKICPICGTLASREHINNVHNIQPVQCEICHAEMRNKTALRKHKNSVHAPTQRVTCPECQQEFENKVKLYAHTYQVHNYQESKCEWCGGTYKNKKMLQAHKRTVHKDLYIGRNTKIYKPNEAT